MKNLTRFYRSLTLKRRAPVNNTGEERKEGEFGMNFISFIFFFIN
jgi:hypothetical protein